MPIINDILREIHRLDERFSSQPSCTGSYYQGLKVNRADEFDINVPLQLQGSDHSETNRRIMNSPVGEKCDSNVWVPSACPHDQISPTLTPGLSSLGVCYGQEEFDMRLPVLGLTNIHWICNPLEIPCLPSSIFTDHVTLMIRFPSSPLWRNEKDMRIDGVVMPNLVKKRFEELFRLAVKATGYSNFVRLTKSPHSPALTFVVKNPDFYSISVDLAPVISLPNLPLPADVVWPHPGTFWPSLEKKENLRQMGIDLVAKESERYWKISYGRMEKELLVNIDEDGGCRKKLQRIMKKMRDDIWCPGNKPVLSSYHLKNLLFWECESHPRADEWTPDKLAERFVGALHNLLTALRSRDLKQFFQLKINLLKIQNDAAERKVNAVISNIEAFRSNPKKYMYMH